MKKLSNLLAALVFVSLVIFIGCSSDSGGGVVVDPLETQAALLQDTWTVDASKIVYNTGVPTDDWSNFVLTISGASASGGSYSTSGVPTGLSDVWPASGTWSFNNGDVGELLRSDGVVIDVTASETLLILTFSINTGGGRSAGIDGTWAFTFDGN